MIGALKGSLQIGNSNSVSQLLPPNIDHRTNELFCKVLLQVHFI